MQPERLARSTEKSEGAEPESASLPLLAAALTQLDEGVIIADASGRIVFVNEAAARMHGIARLDVTPEEYAETYHLLTIDGAPYPSTDLPLSRAVLNGEAVEEQRWRIRRPTGSEISAVGTARPILSDLGERLGAVLILRDDGPRLAAERAEQRAALILDQIADEHLTMDASFRILSVNRAAVRALGVPAESIVGRTHWEAFPASVGTNAELQYRRVVEERVEVHFAHHYVGEGYDRHIEIDAYPTDEGGVAVFWRDVSERVHGQEELQARNEQLAEQAIELEIANEQLTEQAMELEISNEQLQNSGLELEARAEEADAAREMAESERARATSFLDAMSDAYFALDANFRIIGVNSAMETGTRMPRESLLGRVFWEAFPATVGTPFEHHYRAAAAEGVPATFEHAYSDGRLDLFTSVQVYPADGGGIVVFWRDIGPQVRGEQERARLLEAERRSREDAEAAWKRAETVLASIADAFYLLDRDWRFTYVNDAAEPLLQTTREKLIGRTLWEAFPGVAGSEFEGPYLEAMNTGRVTSVEAYFEPLGTWFDVRTYPWSEGVMVHFRDIGVRKRAEEERERLLFEAEEANRAKSHFLSTMSHELRTPLNAIAGYAELLLMGLRGTLTDAQRVDVERIQSAGQHLMSLVNDVLNFARLDAGQIEYHVVDFDLATTVAELEPLLAPQIAAKGLVFHHDMCGSQPGEHRVRADPEKLRQILLNLLSNAIKFTDAGGQISLKCDTDSHAGLVRISVSDTGWGIPEDRLEQIFDPFVQIERSRMHESQQGVGLGLAISRDLARAMGGDVVAESHVGVGSTFTVTLPKA